MNLCSQIVKKAKDFPQKKRKIEMTVTNISRKPAGDKPRGVAIILLLLTVASLSAQNLPDRVIRLDPLGDTTVSSIGVVPLPGTRFYGEFARFTNGSGDQHRWAARTGGYIEFLRVDGAWSVAINGTMEVVMDPLNDIEFNPRAIFWEEGLMVSRAMPWENGSVQTGYTHRCKHDIDNYEVFATTGEREQRTLIYSGPFLRLLHRPTTITSGSTGILSLGGALRYDHYLHLLDDRGYTGRPENDGSLEDLVSSLALSGRLGFDLQGSMLAVSLSGGVQSSFFYGTQGQGGLDAWTELMFEARNPTGMAFGLYLRAEELRDGGILTTPESASLLSLGVRASPGMGMW